MFLLEYTVSDFLSSTKMKTNTETSMLSKVWLTHWKVSPFGQPKIQIKKPFRSKDPGVPIEKNICEL